MLAAPLAAQSSSRNGPRPINLRQDSGQVLQLLDLTFGQRRGAAGQRILGERISISPGSPLTLRWQMMSQGFVPGFVWEENGRIVGNVTLLQSQLFGRYLIANVAVHPDFRRRGIAHTLMVEALHHTEIHGGHQVMLQVEHDNDGAIELYRRLGFKIVGTMNHWQTSTNRLSSRSVNSPAEVAIRPLRKRDWQAAFNLDRAALAPDLNWPVPSSPNLYSTGWLRKFTDLLNGQSFETWVIDEPDKARKNGRLVGLTMISGELGRPHQLHLRIDPAWRGRLEGSLLQKSLAQLKKHRGGTVRISNPREDEHLNELLAQANFQIQRTLTIMRLDLSADKRF